MDETAGRFGEANPCFQILADYAFLPTTAASQRHTAKTALQGLGYRACQFLFFRQNRLLHVATSCRTCGQLAQVTTRNRHELDRNPAS